MSVTTRVTMRGLARLVLADRGVLGQHMRHLVAQHRGQFRGVAGQRDQAARHVELAGRQRERIHRAGIEDRHLVGLVGTIGGRHQPVDGLGRSALPASDRHRRRHRKTGCAHARARRPGVCATVRAGLAAAAWRRRRRGLKPADDRRRRQARSAAHSRTGAAQRRRLILVFVPSRTRPPLSATRIRVRRANSRRAISICPTRSTSIRGPPRASTQPRTRIRRFSRDLRQSRQPRTPPACALK